MKGHLQCPKTPPVPLEGSVALASSSAVSATHLPMPAQLHGDVLLESPTKQYEDMVGLERRMIHSGRTRHVDGLDDELDDELKRSCKGLRRTRSTPSDREFLSKF